MFQCAESGFQGIECLRSVFLGSVECRALDISESVVCRLISNKVQTLQKPFLIKMA